MPMLDSLKRLFVWWDGQTLNTQFFTWRKGVRVGDDAQGNVFYRDAADRRRWVIYKGEAEASKIPPGWYGWMHHRFDTTPAQEDYRPREWEMPHQPNATGTANAYRPEGSVLRSGERPPATGDYEPWNPAR